MQWKREKSLPGIKLAIHPLEISSSDSINQAQQVFFHL
jgi:hypothetical protein